MPSKGGSWTEQRHSKTLFDSDFVQLSYILGAHFVHSRNHNQKAPSTEFNVAYATRTDVRKVLNLQQVVEAVRMQQITIERYEFSRLTMKEQVDIIHRAHVFIGVHGAALSNMIYFQHPLSDRTVIEIVRWKLKHETY